MQIRLLPRYTSLLLILLFNSHVSANPWSDLVNQDLDFVYQTISENHPGPVDIQNSWFKKHLEDGFKLAKKDANQVSSYDDYEAIIARYISGFNDGHLGINFKLLRKQTLWPGFLVAKQGNDFIVTDVASSNSEMPQRNWTLISCDSESATNMMRKYVFPFKRGNPELDGQWVLLAPWLLQGNFHQWSPQLKSCTFSNNSKVISLKLNYQKIDERDLLARVKAINLNPNRRTSLKNIDKDIVWISLPTFNPEGNELQEMQKVVATVSKQRRAKAVVFDVRGNTGGSSLWGHDILAALYGEYFKNLISAADQASKTYVEWRVSKGNLEHVEGIGPWLKERHGENSEGYKTFVKIAADMKVALNKGESLMREYELSGPVKISSSDSKPLTKTKLILLTDGYCGSACLDFMDMALRIPGAIHIGGSTNADTVYMEIRHEDLPSGLGRLGFATKVYRNRPRGNNVAYKPSIFWHGSLANTRALQNWIVEEVVPNYLIK